MPPPYDVSVEAQNDLLEIWLRIAEDSVAWPIELKTSSTICLIGACGREDFGVIRWKADQGITYMLCTGLCIHGISTFGQSESASMSMILPWT